MKQLISFLFILAIVLVFSFQAYATLELRGEGTSVYGTYRLIYDTDFNITWYDYTTTYDTWQNQVNWASGLTVNFAGTIFDDWRLPSTVDNPSVWGYDGTTSAGYNITSSEMGHLFYTELGNKGYYAIDGTFPQPGWGLTSTGDFLNLHADGAYWSGTEYTYSLHTDKAWDFGFGLGAQGPDETWPSIYAIAVRSGDVTVVPEPISSILFLTGGATLIGRKYIRRKKIEV